MLSDRVLQSTKPTRLRENIGLSRWHIFISKRDPTGAKPRFSDVSVGAARWPLTKCMI
jgi:hypothetical protein